MYNDRYKELTDLYLYEENLIFRENVSLQATFDKSFRNTYN
jgi:hypothetical protein